MPSNVFNNESQLPSTRFLSLPSTFVVHVYLHRSIVNLHNGGTDSALGNNNLIQNGGEDNELQFIDLVENTN